MKDIISIDGCTLTVDDLIALSTGNYSIKITKEAWEKIEQGRQVVDNILKEKKVAYGINTGFGLFSNVIISPDKLKILQENLIRSHSAGIGNPLTPERTRMLLALRINVLSKGNSGIRPETINKLVDAFNNDCLSIVPEKGTVGASGDLAPLAHLALGLMGEGKMWNVEDGSIQEASEILKSKGLTPIELEAKEGLALINGTQLITSLGAEAVVRSRNVAKVADIAVSLTLEVLKGTINAFHPRIHQVRPHPGQNLVAQRIRTLLQADAPSELFRSHNYQGKVQDAYTLRCAPQIHGITNDTIDFVQKILNTEINSATDNPMVFTGSANVSEDYCIKRQKRKESSDSLPTSTSNQSIDISLDSVTSLEEAKEEIRRLQSLVKLKEAKEKSVPVQQTSLKRSSDTFYRGGGGFIISGGNFHGEYPAKALDYLAIAVHELANASERRLERLVNPSISGLPAFLVADGGLNSGFMIPHCTAASLVSENKVLTHPSSVDSLSTSGSKEDHVSMGGFAARKALQVVCHVETVLAIEILASCQALDLLRPLKTTKPLECVYELIRSKVPTYDQDRFFTPDIESVVELVRNGTILKVVEPFLENLHVERL